MLPSTTAITTLPLRILLADDDSDDRYFFELVLRAFPVSTELITVGDGEELMIYLLDNIKNLPHLLFLDLNMPKKNGSECLSEIKHSPELEHLPVIICSTSVNDDVADLLYKNGAHYYFRKTEIIEIQNVLHHVLTMLVESNFGRPARENFILTPVAAKLIAQIF